MNIAVCPISRSKTPLSGLPGTMAALGRPEEVQSEDFRWRDSGSLVSPQRYPSLGRAVPEFPI